FCACCRRASSFRLSSSSFFLSVMSVTRTSRAGRSPNEMSCPWTSASNTVPSFLRCFHVPRRVPASPSCRSASCRRGTSAGGERRRGRILDEVLLGAAPGRRRADRRVSGPGRQQHGDAGGLGAEPIQAVEPVRVGQAQVEQDDIGGGGRQ